MREWEGSYAWSGCASTVRVSRRRSTGQPTLRAGRASERGLGSVSTIPFESVLGVETLLQEDNLQTSIEHYLVIHFFYIVANIVNLHMYSGILQMSVTSIQTKSLAESESQLHY